MIVRAGVGLVAALVLAACGADDQATTPAAAEPTATADPTCQVVVIAIVPEAPDADVEAVGTRLRDAGVDAVFVSQIEAFQRFTGELFDEDQPVNVMVEPEQLPASYRTAVDSETAADLLEFWQSQPLIHEVTVEPGTPAVCTGTDPP